MRLGKPVQQKDGRSRPEAAQKNRRFLRLHFDRFKIFKCDCARHRIASARRLKMSRISPTHSKDLHGAAPGSDHQASKRGVIGEGGLGRGGTWPEKAIKF